MNKLKNLTDEEHEELCNFCEENIIECKSSISKILCDGHFCEDAYERFTEEENELKEKGIK